MTTDPRIAVLSAMSSPDWHPVPEAHGMPWDEAEALLAAYDASRDAAVVSPAPDRVTAIYDAIDAFQREHRTGGGLQHAQIRALLAEHLADALPVSPVGQAAHTTRGAVLREAADFYDRLLADIGADTAKDPRYWTGVQHVATGLRRMAAETQPAEAKTRRACANCGHFICNGNGPCGAIVSLSAVSDEKRCPCTGPAVGAQQPKKADGDRIVAYRSALPGALSAYCTNHTDELGGGVMPLTSDDLPDGGTCCQCGVDVLIPQQPTEA